MKKITLLSLALSIGLLAHVQAQNYIKIDATFYSQALDTTKHVNIYLPPDYYVNTEQMYATIYYLHGAGGDQTTGNTRAMWYYNQHMIDTTISSPPAIFVCPDGSCLPYWGSAYVNSELYGTYEDFIMEDVIKFVEDNFRAIPDKNFRNITGSSMGGFGSSWLSVNHPDQFRTCVPCIGFLSFTDSLMNTWRTLCYNENDSYQLDYVAGVNTQLFITSCGAYSPNLNIEPYYIEVPFDTLGNWVDTTMNKWRNFDVSSRVKSLPHENELSWYLIAGTQDYMGCYQTYETFMDSLEFHGIGYNCNYFEGGHEFDVESWIMAIHWIDSIINLEYQTMGVNIHQDENIPLTVYPVPSKGNINISFTVHEPGMVAIDFIDQQGKVVQNIIHTELAKGEHTINSSIGKFSSGIYFIRIQTKNAYGIRKIAKTM